VGAIRIADWSAARLRDTSTGAVNHAEPATLCGNVVDRATPSPLSGRCPRVALIYAPGSSPPEGKRDSAVDEPCWRGTLS
jgi:hypothetical protein